MSLTKAQEEYFRDSKMRDERGDLIKCYHCTSHDFDAFDKSKIGEGRDVGFLGKGFYFTTDDKYGDVYGTIKYECYIDMKNPFVINDLNANKFEDYLKITEIMDYLQDNHPEYGEIDGPKELILEMDDTDANVLSPYDFNGETFLLGFWQDYSKQITEWAKENGYDGILVDQPRSGDVFEIVVFEPNQIKLTDNLFPTRADNFKDNSREYLKENFEKISEKERAELIKHMERAGKVEKSDKRPQKSTSRDDNER